MDTGKRQRRSGEIERELETLIHDVEQRVGRRAADPLVSLELLDRTVEQQRQRIIWGNLADVELGNLGEQVVAPPQHLAVTPKIEDEDRRPRAQAEEVDLDRAEFHLGLDPGGGQAPRGFPSPDCELAPFRARIVTGRQDDEELEVSEHAQHAATWQHATLAPSEAAGQDHRHQARGRQALDQERDAAFERLADALFVTRLAAEREGHVHAALAMSRPPGRRASCARITAAATSTTGSSRPALSSTRSASAFVGST